MRLPKFMRVQEEKEQRKKQKAVLQKKVQRNNIPEGKRGEEIAWQYLKSKGYRLIQKNFKSKLGEIDIIAGKDSTVYFIEVKTRWSTKYGMPEEAVTEGKLNKIKKTALYYSLTHPTLPKKLRILVISILMERGRIPKIKLIAVDE